MVMNPPLWVALEEEIVACRLCPRLVAWREEVARTKRKAFLGETYWGKPVPGFGDIRARLLVIGLAPGAHGSNRTGRMFTGDSSGDFLYPALHRAGFANQTHSYSRDDPLLLRNIWISAVCRCVPPGNKPLPQEMANCSTFLNREWDLLPVQGVVALGKIAYDQTIHLLKNRYLPLPIPPPFGHGIVFEPGNGIPWVLASYHPSRQNTQTGKLTAAMFDRIWNIAQEKLL